MTVALATRTATGAIIASLQLLGCGGVFDHAEGPPPPDLSPPRTAPAALSTAPSASSEIPAAPTVSAASAPASPGRISARHVLIQWMGCERAPTAVVRTRDQARAVAEKVLARARAGEDLGRLAVELSDEPGAAARGGSLGRFGRGQMVRSFEDAAFRLEIGEVSGIVESPFGYHIIQRLE